MFEGGHVCFMCDSSALFLSTLICFFLWFSSSSYVLVWLSVLYNHTRACPQNISQIIASATLTIRECMFWIKQRFFLTTLAPIIESRELGWFTWRTAAWFDRGKLVLPDVLVIGLVVSGRACSLHRWVIVILPFVNFAYNLEINISTF